MAIDYCDEEQLGSFEIIECRKDDRVGGMPAIIPLETGHGITDPSDEAQIQAAIDAGRAHKIERCSLTIDAPSAVEQDSLVPCETSDIVNYDRKGAYVNPNVTDENITQHDRLFDGREFAGLIAAQCNKDGNIDKVSFFDYPVKFKGGLINPGKNTEYQRFEGEWSARSMKNPSMHDVPAGIFS